MIYHKDTGRLIGSYVYMLVCRDDGPMYIKVGITDRPTKRLMALRNGCPITPRVFASIETFSRLSARKIERELHEAFDRWAVHGEWFKLEDSDKPEFNRAWSNVLRKHQKIGWPMRWEQIDIARWAASLASRQSYFRKRFRARGRAYQDFRRHLAS